MATKIGPKTVTQRDRSKSLVFCIDAANYRSYRGEPTINVVTYGHFPGTDTSTASTGWGHSGTAKWSYRDGSQEIPYKGLGLSNPRIVTFAGIGYYNDTGSGHVNKAGGNQFTVSTSTSYTLSFWFRFTGGNSAQLSSQKIRIDLDGGITDVTGNYGTAGWIPYTDVNDTEWHYYHGTNTSHGSTTATQLYFYGQNYATVSGGNYFEIAAVQIEAKDHPTPFQRNDATTNERDESAGGVDQALQNISGVNATDASLAGSYGTFGQSLYKPTTRNVLATIDPNHGHIGGAYWDFDGTDEYIVTPVGFQAGNVRRKTIAIWVSVDGGVTLVGGTTNANTYKWQWMALTGNQPMTGSGYGTRYYWDSVPTDGAWYHVVDVVDEDQGAGNRVRRYLNGVLQSTTALTTDTGDSFYDGTDLYLYIGAFHQGSGATQFLNGRVANCMIWGDALTAKEVKDIYIAQKGRFGK